MTSAPAATSVAPETISPAPLPEAPPGRLTSIDAYRGLVMFLMVAVALNLGRVARLTERGFWDFLYRRKIFVRI